MERNRRYGTAQVERNRRYWINLYQFPGLPSAQPVTEDELREILDRLGAARDIFRQNRELKEVLFRRETETRELRNRNAELEELVRKFAPMLMEAATAMDQPAKNEKP